MEILTKPLKTKVAVLGTVRRKCFDQLFSGVIIEPPYFAVMQCVRKEDERPVLIGALYLIRFKELVHPSLSKESFSHKLGFRFGEETVVAQASKKSLHGGSSALHSKLFSDKGAANDIGRRGGECLPVRCESVGKMLHSVHVPRI